MMNLTPTELERLTIASAAAVSRRRRERGLLLNQAEAEALLADEALEGARDGLDIADIRERVSNVLTTDDVMPYVDTLIPMVCVEGQFLQGSRLITVFDPIRPAPNATPLDPEQRPGAVICASGSIVINSGLVVTELEVVNSSDRAIQITSHYHFFEVNRALQFERETAFGQRLDIAAGTSERFEPGERRVVFLIPIGGHRIVTGHNNLVNGSLDDDAVKAEALCRLETWMATGELASGDLA